MIIFTPMIVVQVSPAIVLTHSYHMGCIYYLKMRKDKGEIGKVIINLKIPLFFMFLFFK